MTRSKHKPLDARASGRPLPATKPKVYVETTVVSYLTARPSRDIGTLARQHATREWWCSAESRFALVTSELVCDEAAFDASVARAPLDALAHVAIIEPTAEAEALAERLFRAGTIPRRASQAGVHVAIAATNDVDYLVTWNLRHLANAPARSAIEQTCRRAGYRLTICTPAELPETEGRTSCDDPIVAEVRAVRESLFAKHGGTVAGLFKHLMDVQRTSGHTYVSYPPTRIEPETHEALPAPSEVAD